MKILAIIIFSGIIVTALIVIMKLYKPKKSNKHNNQENDLKYSDQLSKILQESCLSDSPLHPDFPNRPPAKGRLLPKERQELNCAYLEDFKNRMLRNDSHCNGDSVIGTDNNCGTTN